MQWDDILNFFQKGEDDHTAFIADIESEKDLGPTLISFANKKDGGKIFIGIDIVNYHLIGTEIDQKWIESLIQNFCSPIFSVEIESILRNDKQIICITIQEGKHKPYTFVRKCYIRDRKITRLATLEEEQVFQDQKLLKPAPLIFDAIPEKSEPIQIDQPIEFKNEEPQQTLKKDTASKLNQRQNKIIQYLQTNKSIKNKEYRALFNVSHKTAHLELIQLVSDGYIVSKGLGRNTCYVLKTDQTQQPTLKF